MGKLYKLNQPILGWAKGEHLTYDDNWNEWTRMKTGETLNLRNSIGEGEKVMLLNYLVKYKLTSILEA